MAHRQLEASVGAVVLLLAFGFVALISQHGPSTATERTAQAQQQVHSPIVRTSVRVIPMYVPQAAALVQRDRRS